jgi:predicted NBD/HSP70 family sugar kinase
MTTRSVLAIDLGGTRLRAARAPLDGPIDRIDPDSSISAPTSLAELVEHLDRMVDTSPGLERIGITVPGLVDGTTSVWVPNLPFLDGIDLAGLVSVPVVAGNDAQLALLAEAYDGAASAMTDVVLLAMGTGIGSAVLVDGHIVRGHRGAACSFGWSCLDPRDPGDDDDGWLERHAAGRAFDGWARADQLGDAGVLFELARSGDTRASAHVRGAAERLGAALAGVVATLAPQVVLIAGGLGNALDLFEPTLTDTMQRQLPRHLRATPIRPAVHRASAGLRGAVVAARGGARWWTAGGD